MCCLSLTMVPYSGKQILSICRVLMLSANISYVIILDEFN